MKVKILPTGLYQANCYFLYDEKNNEGVIIDPGDDADIIISQIKSLNIDVKYILLTHAHMDHTGAIVDIIRTLNVPVCVNKSDYDMTKKGIPLFPNFNDNDSCQITYIKNDDILLLGNERIICIETPGHSPGGMCFYTLNMLFSGDTLFNESIGRTDFQGGDYEILINSIKTKLFVLDDDTIVYPGHNQKTSIGHEKSHNYYLS